MGGIYSLCHTAGIIWRQDQGIDTGRYHVFTFCDLSVYVGFGCRIIYFYGNAKVFSCQHGTICDILKMRVGSGFYDDADADV